MDLKVARIFKFEGEGKSKASVDILIGGEILVRGFKIIDGENGRFVGVPREKGKDGKWYAIVKFLTENSRKELEKAVFEAYDK